MLKIVQCLKILFGDMKNVKKIKICFSSMSKKEGGKLQRNSIEDGRSNFISTGELEKLEK